jgi:hypothetical protein
VGVVGEGSGVVGTSVVVVGDTTVYTHTHARTHTHTHTY